MNDDQSPGPQTGATRKKREDKKGKRDKKSLDNIMKSLVNCSPSEKLEIIQEKYRELYTENKLSKANLKTLEKQIEFLKKEKEHIDTELTKSVLGRSKMETLARELQKHNRDIKEENYNRLKEEEEKRKAVSANFTEKLNTLTSLMDDNRDKSLLLREENLNMSSKLTELYNQFQDKEVSLANMNKQIELQKKLSETQLKKIEVEFEAEREVWAKERAMLLTNLEKSEEANSLLQENIKALQSHIDSYQKQYSDFENTMQRSNKVFDTFKQEMQRLQKLNSDLEKDRDAWQSKFSKTAQSILRMTTDLEKKTKEQERLENKLGTLDKFCRRLLVDRTAYMNQLESNNIEPLAPGSEEDIAMSAATGRPTAAFTALVDILNIPPEKQEAMLHKAQEFQKFKVGLQQATDHYGSTDESKKFSENSPIYKYFEKEFMRPCPSSGEGTPSEEIIDEESVPSDSGTPRDYIAPGTYDEQAQELFARVPPMTTPPDVAAVGDVGGKSKGKSKKSGATIVKRGREPVRGKEETELLEKELVDSRQKSDKTGDTSEGTPTSAPYFPSLKPYDLHCTTNISTMGLKVGALSKNLSNVVIDTGDQSLLPECDIGLAVQPNVTGEQENVADGSDEPESNITQEAKD